MTLAVTTLSEQVNLARHLTILALSDSREMVCVCSSADAIALLPLLPLTCKTLHAYVAALTLINLITSYTRHQAEVEGFSSTEAIDSRMFIMRVSVRSQCYQRTLQCIMLDCYAYVMLKKYLSFQMLVVSVGTRFSIRIIIGSMI